MKSTISLVAAVGLTLCGAASVRAQQPVPQTYVLTDIMFANDEGFGSFKVGINATGKVAVSTKGTGTVLQPYLWTPSQPNGTSGTFTTLPFGFASAINDLGQIAGYDDQGLLLYRPGVGVQYLGVPTTPTSRGWANALNNAGQVVGVLSSYDAEVEIDHAFLWDATNGLRDLNDPARVTLLNPDLTPAAGWVVNFAMGINGTGQIAGYGTDPAGQHRIILLTPRP
jgi:probable HAF family extracellular repeat protein